MKKNKFIIIAVIIAILIFLGFGYYIYRQSQINNDNKTYEANKISTNTSSHDNSNNIETKNSESSPETPESSMNTSNSNQNNEHQYIEEQISTFSTPIYSKDPARQNNIKITCDTLNDTVINNGSTFSFCNTVGQSTTAKGYQKADIFDKNGNKKKGLGRRKLSN